MVGVVLEAQFIREEIADIRNLDVISGMVATENRLVGGHIACVRVWGLNAGKAAIATLLSLHRDAAAEYRESPEESGALAETPEEAALVLVANTILNLDAAVSK